MNYFTKDKPYNSLNEYYKREFNSKVAKIALNGGFTCPNKDGKKGYGGCTYCSKLGSGDMAGDVNLSIKEQFDSIKEVIKHKWPNILYMPYFQANSNTYAPLPRLKSLYEEALSLYPDKTIGISIATRSDCLSDEIIDYLGDLNKKTRVQVELGLQSSNEYTSNLINRCESNLEFIRACNKLREHNIEVVVHIINGLPYETKDDMLNTINFINKLDIQGIKIHSLLILKDTKMCMDYEKNPWPILTLDEYVDITVEQLCRLKPNIIIHRLAADSVLNSLITPLWTRRKLVVMNEIDKKMRANNLYQGIYYHD